MAQRADDRVALPLSANAAIEIADEQHVRMEYAFREQDLAGFAHAGAGAQRVLQLLRVVRAVGGEAQHFAVGLRRGSGQGQ